MADEKRDALDARFWKHVFPDPNTGCWHWDGRPSGAAGYGTMNLGERREVVAHRWSYERFRGPIPLGMCVCHSCDVPCCVNPDHLWIGTRADNNADMMAKGRHVVVNRKISHTDIPLIRRLCANGVSRTAIAARYGVTISTISRAIMKHA